MTHEMDDEHRDGAAGSRRSETAQAMLDLAAPLARSATLDTVAASLARSALGMLDAAAVAVVVAPDLAGPTPGTRGVASDPLPPAIAAEVFDEILGTPWGAELVRSSRPAESGPWDLDDAGAVLLGRLGATRLGTYPLIVPGEHLGCVVVAWAPGADLSDPDTILRGRAIRDFGTMAVRGALLLSQLRHRALHDGLTGLANRQLFADRLDRALASARRHGRSLVVITIDLDGFKPINDAFGHDAGDEVLAVLGERLQNTLREEDTLARLGGDEFAVLLPELDDPSVAVDVAEKIRTTISEPVLIGPDRLVVTPSVGAAMFPADGRTRDELMRHADLAMYRAKSLGRDRVVRFERGLLDAVERRATFEQELRAAIAGGGDRRQLVVEYQPQVGLADGRITGLEAFVRWNHPTRGRLEPGGFLAAAEDSGLVVALDTWVLTRACRDLQAWRDAGLHVPRLGVNVSALDLRDPVFVDALREILERTCLPHGSIELEVADGLPLDDDGASDVSLARLRSLGVRLAVDDFGSRRSELAQLQTAPVDTVKIDRRFVAQIGSGDGTGLLVDGIVALVRALGLRAVACGVETDEQRAHLADIGCDAVQGWLYAEPIDAEVVARVLAHAPVVSA